MKFEQAFYTWGENQLSRYKRGLGVCAASNVQPEFLDKCLGVGSLFHSEGTERTAEFTLYSPEFQAFVGVGISPREDGGDGRINKLCHFLIPAEPQAAQNPSEYLLAYPYVREVRDGQRLDSIELMPEDYHYQDILEKYHLRGRKLAQLLWKSYPCMFGESRTLTVLLDEEARVIEEDSQTAREITWLLSVLVPEQGERAQNYRKKLSYGVYTENNTDAVRLLFTRKKENGGNCFYLDREAQETEHIPELYREMARRAEISEEAFREFITEVFTHRYSQNLQCRQLPLMYCKWKLEHQRYVSAEEIAPELNGLLLHAEHSEWHRQFLYDYLKQAEHMKNQELIRFWTRLILPTIKKYEEMSGEERSQVEQAVQSVLCRMFSENRKNYHMFLNDLPSVVRSSVLQSLYAQEDSVIEQEGTEIQTADEVCAYLANYRELTENKAFCEQILEYGEGLYSGADRNDRQKITGVMKDCGLAYPWNQRVVKGIYREETKSYLSYLEQEFGKIENCFWRKYYFWLVCLAKKAAAEDIAAMIKYEEQLWRIAPEEMSEEDEKEIRQYADTFRQYWGEWIKSEPLSNLLEYDMEELQKRGRKTEWLQCVCEKLGEQTDEALYRKLLDRLADIAQSITKEEVYKFRDYEAALWNLAAQKEYPLGLKWKILFQIRQQKNVFVTDKHFVWTDIRPDCAQDMEELYQVLQENPELREVCERKSERADIESEIRRNLYLIWECLREERRITYAEMDFLNPELCRENGRQIRKFFTEQQELIAGGAVYPLSETTVGNYFYMQQMLETYWKQEQREQIQRCEGYRIIEREYPQFADYIRENNPKEIKNPRIIEMWDEMKGFLCLLHFPKTDRENLEAASEFWGRCQSVFACAGQLREMQELRKGCEKVMLEIEKEYRKAEQMIGEIEHAIERLEADKRRKLKELSSLAEAYNQAAENLGLQKETAVQNVRKEHQQAETKSFEREGGAVIRNNGDSQRGYTVVGEEKKAAEPIQKWTAEGKEQKVYKQAPTYGGEQEQKKGVCAKQGLTGKFYSR